MGVSKIKIKKQKADRLGEENMNNQGCLMRIIEYNKFSDIVVEFQDGYRNTVNTNYDSFKNGSVDNPSYRKGETNINHQGCVMKIIKYNKANDIVVEFQDDYKGVVHTQYSNFQRGNVRNPFYPFAYGVGITGDKYSTRIKEYQIWINMMARCFDDKLKEKYPTYKYATCCEEWLYYPNFYEWLHSQPNFNKWYNGRRWNLDKDILVKGNKVYSPETTCLVPQNVNTLFVKKDKNRGNLPIGVSKCNNGFKARCQNPITKQRDDLGDYSIPYYAFLAYKRHKEDLIKQVAQIEYDAGNITEECYDAMMNYEVEITD